MRARTLLLALIAAPFFTGCVCDEDGRSHRQTHSVRVHDGDHARAVVVVRPASARKVSHRGSRRWFVGRVDRIQAHSGSARIAPRQAPRSRNGSHRKVEAMRERIANARRGMKTDKRKPRLRKKPRKKDN